MAEAPAALLPRGRWDGGAVARLERARFEALLAAPGPASAQHIVDWSKLRTNAHDAWPCGAGGNEGLRSLTGYIVLLGATRPVEVAVNVRQLDIAAF